MWLYSLQAEVFALNNLIGAVLLYLAARYERRREAGAAISAAFAMGLGMSNQHTIGAPGRRGRGSFFYGEALGAGARRSASPLLTPSRPPKRSPSLTGSPLFFSFSDFRPPWRSTTRLCTLLAPRA